MKITQIHHVQITVPTTKLQAAHDFYCGVLSLEETYRPDVFTSSGFWVKLGNGDVHIGVEDHITRAGTKHHIAYQVDDLEAWRVHLGAHGVKTEDPVQFAGHVRFQFRDPFGNQVEMIQVL